MQYQQGRFKDILRIGCIIFETFIVSKSRCCGHLDSEELYSRTCNFLRGNLSTLSSKYNFFLPPHSFRARLEMEGPRLTWLYFFSIRSNSVRTMSLKLPWKSRTILEQFHSQNFLNTPQPLWWEFLVKKIKVWRGSTRSSY